MITCPFCGTTHAANTLFCSECGTYLLEDDRQGTDSLGTDELGWIGEEDEYAKASHIVLDTGPISILLTIGEHRREVRAGLLKAIHLGRLAPASGAFPEINLTQDKGVEKGVSRQHARILKRKGTVVVEDLGSTNGTFINGKRLTPYLPEALHSGDQLQLGKLLIEVELFPGGKDSELGVVPQETRLRLEREVIHLLSSPAETFPERAAAFLAELDNSAKKKITIDLIKVNHKINHGLALKMITQLIEMWMKESDYENVGRAALAMRHIPTKQPLAGLTILLQVTKPAERYVHDYVYQALGDLMKQEERAVLTSLETLIQHAGEGSSSLLYWISREMLEGPFKSLLDASRGLFSQAGYTVTDIENFIDMLRDLSEGANSKDLLLAYRTLFEVLGTRTISDISAFCPPDLSGWDDIPLTKMMQVIEQLAEISNLTKKCALVEDLGDRLYYLSEALAVVENINEEISTKRQQRERILCAKILTRWQNIIIETRDGLKGRAVLQVELLTKQAFPGEQIVLALKLQNTGQALAENVTLRLEPLADYEIIGRSAQHIAGISAKRSAQFEFTIRPQHEGWMRVEVSVIWDDPEHKQKEIRFGDTISFFEVKEEFVRIPNPYVAGNPITSPKLFFGRQDVFDFVLENLMGTEQKNTLVFHGQRRTGKTSILLQLRDRILTQAFIPVYIDMEALADVKTMNIFLEYLAHEISRAARKRCLDANHGEGRIDQSVKKNKLQRWFWVMLKLVLSNNFTGWMAKLIPGVPPSPPLDTAFSKHPTVTFDRFMDEIENTLSGQRFVVMFDEFELIERKITQGMDVDVLNYFRNLMQHRDSLIFIFAGTHRLQEMTHDYWSILFSIALNREISFLGEEGTRRLITEPVKGHLKYDDLTIEKIIRVTHCQPYLVQLICWQLVNYLNRHERSYATINDLNEVLDETLKTAEAYFYSIWSQATSLQRLVLALLTSLVYPGKETATLSEIESGLLDKRVAVTSQELIAALSELYRQDVLEERGNSELHYHFQIDLIRMWIEKNKPLARVLLEYGY